MRVIDLSFSRESESPSETKGPLNWNMLLVINAQKCVLKVSYHAKVTFYVFSTSTLSNDLLRHDHITKMWAGFTPTGQSETLLSETMRSVLEVIWSVFTLAC